MRPLFWIILVTAGLVVRIIAVFDAPNTLRGDEISFDVYGWSVAQGKGIAKADGTLTSIRPPLYPLFLGSVYSLLGHRPLAVKLVQCFLGIATLIFAYQMACVFLPLKLARWVALLETFYLPNIMAPTRLYAESLYLFCLSLAFWWISCFWRNPKTQWAIGSGVALGLATLTRAAGLPLAFILTPLLAWRTKKLKRRMTLGLAALFLVGFFLPILPWTLRNLKVHHAWVLLTTEPGHTLYYAYFPKDGKIFGIVDETDLSRQASKIENELEKSQFLTQGVIQSILNNPQQFLMRQVPLKIAYFWSPFYWELFGKGTYDGTYVFLFPFFLWGLGALLRAWREYLPIYLLMFYPFFLALLFYGSDRMRYPTTPSFLIFSALGLKQFFQKWKLSPIPIGLLIVFAGGNLFLTLNSQEIKEWTRWCLQMIGMW